MGEERVGIGCLGEGRGLAGRDREWIGVDMLLHGVGWRGFVSCIKCLMISQVYNDYLYTKCMCTF